VLLTHSTLPRSNAQQRRSSGLYLLTGSVLVFMTFMRYSLPPLGWIAFAPFLAFLYDSVSMRRLLALLAVLAVAFVATVSKMATPEIPWAPPVPMFAVPLAMAYFVAVMLAALAHHRLGTRWGIYAFPSTVVALGWIQYTFTPGSSWGALAHTQLDSVVLMQLVSLTGLGGLTFVVALGSSLAAAAWRQGVTAVRSDLVVFAILVTSISLYGQLRLGSVAPGPTVRVAGVVSPVTHKDFHAAFADIDTLRPFDDELFTRTAHAADLGARVVVWNEMATVVTASGEKALTERGQAFAQQRGVMLVMAYGVATSMRPFHDVNKYRLYLPDGTMADEYVKRHPVPGDPDEVGTVHARIVRFGDIRFTGAICYDYGFPGIARDNAMDGADIALVPSSDWRGIDPEHAQMAVMNAVAVGLPMLRPVRAARSFATDQFGHIVGSLPANSSEGVLVVALPSRRVPTLYTTIGESLPLAALAFSLFVGLRLILRSVLSRR